LRHGKATGRALLEPVRRFGKVLRTSEAVSGEGAEGALGEDVTPRGGGPKPRPGLPGIRGTPAPCAYRTPSAHWAEGLS
jgi:hypothetical protein